MFDGQVDVCIIEDDASQRALLVSRVTSAGYTVAQAETAQEGINAIRDHHPRVVLCDLGLPDFRGTEVCRFLRSHPGGEGVYVVVISAHADARSKAEALNAGADDYLVKPHDDMELYARIRNGLRIYSLQDRLRRAAITDGLTGVANYSAFYDHLGREFARAQRYGHPMSLLMVDLDHFKAVNDTFGHEIGNQVLRTTARQLERLVRGSDLVARYGGEEFVIIMPESSMDAAAQLAERVRIEIAARVRVASAPHLRVTTSIGVSCSSDARVRAAGDLVMLADQVLYRAKEIGRNRVVRSDGEDDNSDVGGIDSENVDRLRKQVAFLSLRAKEMCVQAVWAFVQAIESRDPFTAHHSKNTTAYADELAEAAGWTPATRGVLSNAAMLHELGRIAVPDRIFAERGPLSEDDAALVRQIPAITCKILEPLRAFEGEIAAIRHLRERWDGGGFPSGLTGPVIPQVSRMLAIAEAFDALTSDRPHRPSRTLDEAVELIQQEAGRQFDPDLAQLLARVADERRAQWQARIDVAHRHKPVEAPAEK